MIVFRVFCGVLFLFVSRCTAHALQYQEKRDLQQQPPSATPPTPVLPSNVCNATQPLLSVDNETCISSSVAGATLDLNLPTDCPYFNTTDLAGVWHTVVGTGRDVMQVSGCQRFWSNVNFYIFQGECDSLTCVPMTDALTDYPENYMTKKVQWLSEEGITYRVLVVGGIGERFPEYGMKISSFDSPANGECEDAVMHPGDGSLYTGSSFVHSEQSPKLPDCLPSDTNDRPAVWYTVIGTGGQMIADTCHDETDFRAALQVFTGKCAGSLACESEVVFSACGNTFANGGMRASWNSVKGETYSIMIQGFGFRTTFVGVIPLKLYGNYGITIGSFVAPMNDQCNDTQIPEALNKPFEGTLVGATSFKSDTNVSGSCIDDAVQALVFFSSVPPEFVSTAWHTVTGTGSILVAELNKPDFVLFVVINVFEGTCVSFVCADTLEFSSWASREGALSQWKSIPGRNYFVVVTAATANNNWQDEYTVTIREENSDPPVCFPGESIVDVRNKGLVRLDTLQIGDYVRVGIGDIFDRVYSFGHKHESAIADYLCIHVRGIDTPLIISRAHLVFIAEGASRPGLITYRTR